MDVWISLERGNRIDFACGLGIGGVEKEQKGSCGKWKPEGESTGRDVWNKGVWGVVRVGTDVETWCSGNSLVSTRVTLAKSPSTWG